MRVFRPAAHAPDDDVGVEARLCHLDEGFLTDDGLVQHHVVQHAAQRVVGVVVLGGDFHRFTDGDAQAARGLWVAGQDHPAGFGGLGRAGNALGAPDVHHAAPVRLLVVRHLDHVHEALEAEHLRGHGQGRTPLARARLGRQLHGAFGLVVVGLGNRGVGLMRAGRADALVLVEDLGRGAQRLLPLRGADERRGTPDLVDLLHFFRDLDVVVHGHFLHDERHGEERSEVCRTQRLQRTRMERRRRRSGKIRGEVVPTRWHPVFAKDVLLGHCEVPLC
jgi:hypothetical protein